MEIAPNPEMPKVSNEELAMKIKAGEKELIPVLWEQIKRLIWRKAWGLWVNWQERCQDMGVEYGDICQAGFFAMMKAVETYDPCGEYAFTTYLNFPMKSEFSKLIGKRTTKEDAIAHSRRFESQISSDKDGDALTLYSTLADTSAESDMEGVIELEYAHSLRDALEKALNKLSPKWAHIVRSRYFEGKSGVEVAAELGLTGARIHNIEREAFRKLRKDRQLNEYRDEIIGQCAYLEGAEYRNAIVHTNEGY